MLKTKQEELALAKSQLEKEIEDAVFSYGRKKERYNEFFDGKNEETVLQRQLLIDFFMTQRGQAPLFIADILDFDRPESLARQRCYAMQAGWKVLRNLAHQIEESGDILMDIENAKDDLKQYSAEIEAQKAAASAEIEAQKAAARAEIDEYAAQVQSDLDIHQVKTTTALDERYDRVLVEKKKVDECYEYITGLIDSTTAKWDTVSDLLHDALGSVDAVAFSEVYQQMTEATRLLDYLATVRVDVQPEGTEIDYKQFSHTEVPRPVMKLQKSSALTSGPITGSLRDVTISVASNMVEIATQPVEKSARQICFEILDQSGGAAGPTELGKAAGVSMPSAATYKSQWKSSRGIK